MQRELLKLLRQALSGELRKAKRRRTSATGLVLVVGLTIAVFAIDYFLREPDLPVPDAGRSLSCEVRSVADGDTVTVGCEDGRLTVRVWGIDAPESGQKPWGEESKNALQELIDRSGRRLTVEVVDKDRYGRAVARLYGGQGGAEDLGLALVRAGQAIVYDQYNDSQGYRDAQSQARSAGLGVWSRPGPQQDPAAWRRVNPRGA